MPTGLTHGLDTGFCARCFPAPPWDDPRAPLVQIAAQILSVGYLWDRLRTTGGAYGAACAYDPWAGSFAMTSHGDPDIARTIRVFDGVPAAVRQRAWPPAEIEQAVLACAREEETPVRPGMATDVALWRHVAGVTQDRRRRWRQAQLAATPEAVRTAALEMLQDAEPCQGTAALSSRSCLRQAALALGQAFALTPLVGPPQQTAGPGSGPAVTCRENRP